MQANSFNGALNGCFTLNLNNAPSNVNTNIGFRCCKQFPKRNKTKKELPQSRARLPSFTEACTGHFTGTTPARNPGPRTPNHKLWEAEYKKRGCRR